MNSEKARRAVFAFGLIICGYGLAEHFAWIGVIITAAMWSVVAFEN